jgi:uncharacterized protein (DUF2249 family)
MITGPIGNRRIYDRLKSLKVGQELKLEISEWKGHTTPQSLNWNPRYQGQFTVRRLADGTGWVVMRLKRAITGKGNVSKKEPNRTV